MPSFFTELKRRNVLRAGAFSAAAAAWLMVRYLWLPAFDAVRADPRFKAVLAELNIPESSGRNPAP